MCETEEVIREGKYVIVKKQNYRKVYKVTGNGTLMLGKDQIDMRAIIGKRFWTTFEMIPVKSKPRSFSLKEASGPESWDDLLNELPSGNDNRTINDDNTSQRLSKGEILQLQESGKTGKEIVGSLIENNKSFLDRTEYSQEKYVKRKERKYFRFLMVCKPKLSSLHDIYFKLDHSKIGNLRMDALAQLLSYSDVQSEGLYLLYDSGSQGLAAAAMLNRIGADTEGNLIHFHPGNLPQMTIVNAMNFPGEQLDRCLNVNIYSFLRLYYQGEDAVLNNIQLKRTNSNANTTMPEKVTELITEKQQGVEEKEKEVPLQSEGNRPLNEQVVKTSCINVLKKKADTPIDVIPFKRPKWLTDLKPATELVQKRKARGLVVVAKEHPFNIVNALFPFLGPSRPFVIFHSLREPLQETYMMLKQRKNVVNLRLFSNFLRSYQILVDRTHPDILTNDTGGYLLTGYFVED